MRNILCKLPEKARPGIKKLIQKAFTAQSHKTGLERAQAVVAMYEQEYPEAMKCLATSGRMPDGARFPETHRKRIGRRICWSACLARVRRASYRISCERSGLSLVFAVLVDASAGWRGVSDSAASKTWKLCAQVHGGR
jgi:transposase-like protein